MCALDPTSGKALWTTSLPSRVIAAVTAVPGLVVVEGGSTLTVLSSATGKVLFMFHDTTIGATFDGPATIVNGVLYVGNIDGNLYAFTV